LAPTRRLRFVAVLVTQHVSDLMEESKWNKATRTGKTAAANVSDLDAPDQPSPSPVCDSYPFSYSFFGRENVALQTYHQEHQGIWGEDGKSLFSSKQRRKKILTLDTLLALRSMAALSAMSEWRLHALLPTCYSASHAMSRVFIAFAGQIRSSATFQLHRLAG
jgi:hypothetical protein